MNDFVAFRVLRDSIPLTEEAYERTSAQIDGFVRRCGLSLAAVERALALYKLKMELKVTSSDRSE